MGASSERYAKSVGESPVLPSGANELEALRRHEEAGRKRTSLTWCAVLLIVLSFTDVPMSPGTVAIRLGIAALAAAAGLDWERVAGRWPEELPPVVGDRRRLVQVLVNLLVNAAEVLEPAARKDGIRGRILLRVRLNDAPSAGAGDEGGSAPARLSLTVHDSGPGIAPQHLAQMFTPFFTTKPVGKGTGLGLALSRSYMEQMGGRLEAGNHPDGGAEFRLELPIAGREEDSETERLHLAARIGVA